MALNSQLIKFKSPGTKILTEIAENIPQTAVPSGTRILVINSRKGRVNQLVAISTFTEYKRQFDNISDADERRGNWSARSAEYMLKVAPIYVLNLRSFDDTLDKAGYQELSTSTAIKNAASKEKPYSKLFNTTQMWKIDPDQLIANLNTDKLLVFGNIGSSDLSVFVRRTKTTQSSLTFATWYSNLGTEIPAYVNPDDEVSSWFVDVMIFKNSFTSNSANNVSYGYCFEQNGLVKKSVVSTSGKSVDGLTQLASITESGYLGTVTGSLVQGFTDDRGQVSDIVTLLNSTVNESGLLCARNERIYDDAATWYIGETPNSNEMKRPVPVDFKGHNLCNINEVGAFDGDAIPAEVNFGSYSYEPTISDSSDVYEIPSFDEVVFDPSDSEEFTDATVRIYTAAMKGKKVGSNIEVADKSVIYVRGEKAKPSISDNFVGFDGNLSAVDSVKFVKTGSIFKYAQSNKLAIQPFGTFDGFDYPKPGQEFPKDANGLYYVYPVGHQLAGKPLVFETSENDVLSGIYHSPDSTIVTAYVDALSNMSWTDMVTIIDAIAAYTDSSEIFEASDFAKSDWNVLSDPSIFEDLVSAKATAYNIYEVVLSKNLALNDGDFETPASLDPIAYDSSAEFVDTTGNTIVVYNNSDWCFKVKSSDDSTTSYNALSLKSYKARNTQFIDGTASRQNEILNVMLEKPIKDALSNRDLTSWNYIVDAFKSYVEPNVKSQFKDVAESRIIARAIYNMPSIADFQRSTNPYFSEEIDGNLEVKYITTGGNLQLPYNNTFSLPSVNGWYAYGFGPNLTLSGSTKTMPPAAVASNLFQRKHLNGKPYMILAGPTDGAIRETNVSGVEHVFNETNDGQGDRDFLDPFGYNVIVNKASGLQIYGNKTSQNTVSTPVSAIHSSEVLMFVQQRINLLLETRVFKLNNSQNRLTIKQQADSICDEPLGVGAISGYVNVMDRSNNTNEVIANKIGILDTTLFDANGMEILVHRTKFDTITNIASYEVVRSNL